MYPRNNASPPRIAIGAVVQIADGAVQTSGVSVVVRPEGGAESAGGGTIAYSAASGVVYYTPSQAETNYTAFCVIAYKADCIPAQVTVVTTASSTAGTAELDSAATAALVDLIWDEPLTGATHNVATSSGKRLRQTTAFQQIDSTVVDASATTTTFVTGLTSAVDDFFNDSMLVFTDGALAGQVRAIYDYVGATKTIILEEALTSAPVNGVAFTIVSLHIHPVSQIQSGLATAASIVTLRGADSDTLKTLSDQIDTVSTNVSSIASVSREAF
jgi:hypothetical protein